MVMFWNGWQGAIRFGAIMNADKLGSGRLLRRDTVRGGDN